GQDRYDRGLSRRLLHGLYAQAGYRRLGRLRRAAEYRAQRCAGGIARLGELYDRRRAATTTWLRRPAAGDYDGHDRPVLRRDRDARLPPSGCAALPDRHRAHPHLSIAWRTVRGGGCARAVAWC